MIASRIDINSKEFLSIAHLICAISQDVADVASFMLGTVN